MTQGDSLPVAVAVRKAGAIAVDDIAARQHKQRTNNDQLLHSYLR